MNKISILALVLIILGFLVALSGGGGGFMPGIPGAEVGYPIAAIGLGLWIIGLLMKKK